VIAIFFLLFAIGLATIRGNPPIKWSGTLPS
jgi:hypothetical protein